MSLVSSDQNLYPQPLKRRKSEPIPINRSLQVISFFYYFQQTDILIFYRENLFQVMLKPHFQSRVNLQGQSNRKLLSFFIYYLLTIIESSKLYLKHP